MMKIATFAAAAPFAMAALFLAAITAPASARYPNKPVRIVVPVTTGGPSDLVARILGDKLSTSLGQPMVIENRPGASQTVGMAFVAKSDPDGYTLLQAAACSRLPARRGCRPEAERRAGPRAQQRRDQETLRRHGAGCKAGLAGGIRHFPRLRDGTLEGRSCEETLSATVTSTRWPKC